MQNARSSTVGNPHFELAQRGKGAAPIRLNSSAVGGVRVWMGGPLSGLPRSFLVFCQRTPDRSPLSLMSNDSRAAKCYILRVML
jgi:hypothetical protein